MEAVQGSALLVYALVAVIALIVLIAKFKMNPFIVLIVVSLVLGLAVGMPMGNIVKAFETGVGLGFTTATLGATFFCTTLLGLGFTTGATLALDAACWYFRFRSGRDGGTKIGAAIFSNT